MRYLVKALSFGGYFVTLFAVAAAMGFAALYLYLGPNLPNVDSIRDIRLQTPMTIYSRDGDLIDEFGDKRRIPVTLDQVPQSFIDALIATEDKRFFEHSGVDFFGVVRAFINNVVTGTRSQGASTITQLVARNVYLDREKTFTRKFREMFLAWKIESEISKEEILELFINKAHFSHRAYGLGAAAQVYYGKALSALALDEVAVLAGIPKGESIYNPISNPDNALTRRNHVLGRMLAENYISQQEYDDAIARPIDSRKHGADVSFSAPYLAEMVRREMIERFGREDAYNSGYRVYTTLDNRLQLNAQQALRESLLEYDFRHGYRGPEQTLGDISAMTTEQQIEFLNSLPTIALLKPALVTDILEQSVTVRLVDGELSTIEWTGLEWASPFINSNQKGRKPAKADDILAIGDVIRVVETADGLLQLSQIPEVSGGFIALSPKDGAVEALIGGYDFSLNQFNMVTQARRQPGSSIKPFIYSAALEKGFTAASMLNDAPFVKEDTTAEGFWRPKNDSGRYKGPTRLRDALRLSNNSISVRLINEIGAAYAEDYLLRFGFPDEFMQPYASLALGSASFTPIEMATGYAVFANGGYKVEPYFIDRIETANEDVVFQAEPIQVCEVCLEKLAQKEFIEQQESLEAEFEELLPRADAGAEKETSSTPLPTNQAADDLLDEALVPEPFLPIAKEKVAPRVVEARNVFILNSMMRDVIQRGTAWRQLNNTASPLLQRSDIGGKTGTTNDAKDAWFSGFNGDYVATAWVGFADYSLALGDNEYGGKAALPIWQRFMEQALNGRPNRTMAQPEGLVNARINPETGKLASSSTTNAIFETFRLEYLPDKEPDQDQQTPDVFDEEIF